MILKDFFINFINNKMLNKMLSFFGLKRQREVENNKVKKKSKTCRCPICTEFIVNCVITDCGHSFCEYCLNQSLIYSPTCPLCRKRIGINSYIPCKSINSVILSQLTDQQFLNYKQRKKQNKQWKESKILKNTKVGMKIDALDTEEV